MELNHILNEFKVLETWAGSFYDLIFIFDLELEEFLIFNENGQKIFAEELNQLCPLKLDYFNRFMLFSERQKFQGIFSQLQKNGQQLHDEDIRLKVGGESKIFRFKAQLRGPQNKFAVVLAKNVSDVYQIYEDELNSQLDAMFYKTAIDSFAMSLRLDSQFKITHASTEFLTKMKQVSGQVVGCHLLKLPSSAEGGFTFSNLKSQSEGSGGWQSEVTYTDSSGQFSWYDMIVFPVTGLDGVVDSYLAIFHDNTETRKLELEAQRETAWKSTILNNSPIAIISTDVNGEIMTFNEAAEQITGFMSHEVIKQFNIIQFHEPKEIEGLRREIESQGTIVFNSPIEVLTSGVKHNQMDERIWSYIKKDGSRIKVSLMMAGARNQSNELIGIIFYAIDITQKIQNEMLLEEQKISLISKSKLATLGEMSAGVAHEINNPLTIIRGKAELALAMLKMKNPEYLPRVMDYSSSIIAMTERITKIVKGLRTFARDADGDPFETKNISMLVDETLELCSTRFQNHGVKLIVHEIDPNLEVMCRYIQLSQVLLNLLTNAFDAIQDNSEKWVAIKVETNHQLVRLTVTDSGKGIPQHIVDKMMNPFFTTKDIGKGTGLGLSISKGIIESHQGKLFFNRHSANTQFVIEIPLTRTVSSGEAA